jgi:hypothetical protein
LIGKVMVRYLRIVVSATSALACLVFVAMWVRTAFSCDTVLGPVSSRWLFITTSRQGGLGGGVRLPDAQVAQWELRFNPPDTKPSFPYKTALGFGLCWSVEKGLHFVRAPYWFLILGAATMTTLSIRGKRWRFSVRTMLIAMTVVAAVLGAFVILAG